MKIFKFFSLFLVACLLFFSGAAQAQNRIAVLDVQRLLTEAKAAQHIQAQVKTEREAFLKKISEQEQVLRGKEKALLEEAPSLSKEALAEKRTSFEKEFQEARLFAQKGKDRLDNALLGAMNDLRDNITKIVEDISQEQGYDIVLARQYVVAGGKSLDISEETLKRLDKAVPQIPLEFEQ